MLPAAAAAIPKPRGRSHVLPLSRPIFISQAIYKAAGVPRISPRRERDAILPVKSSDYVGEERRDDPVRDSPPSWLYRNTRMTGLTLRFDDRSRKEPRLERSGRIQTSLVMCETFRPNYNEMCISFSPSSISPPFLSRPSSTSTRNHLFGTGSILSSLRCFLGIDGRSRAGDAPSISLSLSRIDLLITF